MKKKIVIKMLKFVIEIVEFVMVRVIILNIWYFVQKLIIYINIQLVVLVGCYNDKCCFMGYNKFDVYIEI